MTVTNSLASRDGQFDIWMGLVVGGSLVRITNDANLEARPRWWPDGTKIAYARLNEDGLWDDMWVVPALGGTPGKLLAEADKDLPGTRQAVGAEGGQTHRLWRRHIDARFTRCFCPLTLG